jgi:hypothetical protein
MDWKILTTLHTAKIGPALWILTKDMVYATPEGVFSVPAGYLTDHASVPRMFTSVVPPVKSAVAEASILHDWFYNKDSEDVPRAFADKCIKELTIANGGSKSLANVTYAAVRVGGRGLYNKEYSIDKLRDAYPEFRDLDQLDLEAIFLIGE